jgi:hypothetical protein
MTREKITSREKAYQWLCRMCDVHRENISEFIDLVIKVDGHMGLDSEELKYLEECNIHHHLEKILLTDD